MTERYPSDSDLISKLAAINPRTLNAGELPSITRATRTSGPRLEQALVENGDKTLFYDNGHGSIIRYLVDIEKQGKLQLPIKILNLDFHADIAPYTDEFVEHTASWQRFGVDHDMWDRDHCYQWQPPHSNCPPMKEFTPEKFITPKSTEDLGNVDFDVLSVDLDFMQSLDTPEIKQYLLLLRTLVKRANHVFVCSSSSWTIGKIDDVTIEQAVATIQSAFKEEEEESSTDSYKESVRSSTQRIVEENN